MLKIRQVLVCILCFPWGLVLAASVNTEINGLKDELLGNVQAYLSIYKESEANADLSTMRIQQLHKQATNEIKEALQPFGYYDVEVQKQLEENEKQWTARYDIKLGAPIRVQQLEYTLSGEGDKEPEFVSLVNTFPLKEGAVLDHELYKAAKQDIQTAALANGYLNAKFTTNEIRINLEKYQASIRLHFNTGPQFYFGDVRFIQGEDELNEDFLRRYLTFESGDPYNAANLLELQTTLSDSDHFERIEIRELSQQTEGLRVPIEINLTPRKPRRYRFGIGYGTDSGARASVEHQRRVSPKGHVLTLKGKTSERINRVDMQYTIPLQKPAAEQLDMTANYLEQETESRKTYAGALDLRRIHGRVNWRQSEAITYEREDYRVGDEYGSSQLLMPNFDWLHHVFNNRLYPTKGRRYTAEIWLSSQMWLSDVDFAQLKVTGKWIVPIFAEDRILVKLHTGGTLVDNVSDLPASKRFYAGGDQSIRGYAFEELGPKDSNGDIIGGKYLVVAGVEYEHRIKENWGVAIFYDAGNSFNDFSEKIYRGVGIGGRWRSRIGPIRLDVGWPLDKAVTYPRLHLIIGLDL